MNRPEPKQVKTVRTTADIHVSDDGRHCDPSCDGRGRREHTCDPFRTPPGGLRYLRTVTVDGQVQALRCRACLKAGRAEA